MKLQKPPRNYHVLSANIGFPPGYSTAIGSQIQSEDSRKPPYLVTSTKRYIADRVDYDMENQYNFYLLFYPTNDAVWKTGVLAANKADPTVYYACWAVDYNIKNSFLKCFQTMFDIVEINKKAGEINKNNVKLAVWITKWLERLPRQSLQDLLHLEDYTEKKVKNG